MAAANATTVWIPSPRLASSFRTMPTRRGHLTLAPCLRIRGVPSPRRSSRLHRRHHDEAPRSHPAVPSVAREEKDRRRVLAGFFPTEREDRAETRARGAPDTLHGVLHVGPGIPFE